MAIENYPASIAPEITNPSNSSSPTAANQAYDWYRHDPGATDRPALKGTPAPTTNEFIFPTGEEAQPYSGLPTKYRDMLLGFVMPQLQQSVTDMPQNIDDYTQNALGTYRQELDMSLKDIIPRHISNLANRGILSSSVASDTLSQAVRDAALKSSGMGYQTAMEAARMKAEIPQTIGQLLGFGQYAADPTVMYRTIAQLLANEMG